MSQLYRSPLVIFLLLAVLLSACSGKKATLSETERIETYIATLRSHLSEEYNQDIAFYADLSLPAKEPRFHVLDLNKNRVVEKNYCLNGRTDDNGNVIYSNEPNSNCSSHGLAKVSYRYNGRFGKAYKLVGLEGTNSNMMRRAVVLHSYPTVPTLPVYYFESEGCPTVSPAFLETLSVYIDNSRKPILLYIE